MKKLNNKWLVLALVVLAGAFLLSRFFRAPGLESTLRQQLVKIDSAATTELRVKPANGTEEVRLTREGVTWKVAQGTKSAFADGSTVKSALGSLLALKPLRMVSRKKDKWTDFQVGEGGTVVTLFENGSQEHEIHIGKTNFVQSPQGGFGGAYTYVRIGDETEVYAVDGFLESSFNRAYADWRNKNFLRVSREAVTKIAFNYPADSSFVLERKDSVWQVNGATANTANVDAYLGQLTFKNLNNFADDFQPGPAAVTIQISAKGGPLETIEAWPLPDSKWAFRSTQQPVIFTSEGSSVIQDLLRGRKYFEK
jgi:hypothetical protein